MCMRDLVLRRRPMSLRAAGASASGADQRCAVGSRLRKLDMEMRRELLSLFTMSAGDYLDRWFESDPIKAVFGFDGVVGNYASPYTPGSAYVLLHHVFGEVNGKKGAWGHAIGGMGAITQAMAKAAAARGVEIRVGSAVREVLVEGDRAVGAVTESGETLRATAVISNLNPKLLYLNMFARRAAGPIPRADEPLALRFRHVPHERRPDGAAGLQLPAGQDRGDHHTAGIIIAPTLGYMEQAYFDARTTGWSKKPIVEMCIPSTLDDSLAPPGQHVASLFCQHVAPQLPNGRAGTRTARQSPT